mmetsp:Transcript_5968/g.14311  ORF Transcript_5968/g.14311 Transcript_5968/m.14311 type:complete len:227 (-) Transcript_5968:305-985(-)
MDRTNPPIHSPLVEQLLESLLVRGWRRLLVLPDPLGDEQHQGVGPRVTQPRRVAAGTRLDRCTLCVCRGVPLLLLAVFVERLDELVDMAESDHLAGRHVCDVCGPRLHAVKYVGSVDDRHAALHRLLIQKLQQVLPRHDVQVGGDLVQQQHVERFDEAQQQLHATPLTLRHLVHPPLEVNPQHVYEVLQPLRVRHSSSLEHRPHRKVSLVGHAVAAEGHITHPIAA